MFVTCLVIFVIALASLIVYFEQFVFLLMFFFAVCSFFCFSLFFFFKQKTAYEMRISDWSSDVCSSDLRTGCGVIGQRDRRRQHWCSAIPPMVIPHALVEASGQESPAGARPSRCDFRGGRRICADERGIAGRGMFARILRMLSGSWQRGWRTGGGSVGVGGRRHPRE